MSLKQIVFLFAATTLIFATNVMVPAPAGAQAKIMLTYANFPPATTFPCVQMERWA